MEQYDNQMYQQPDFYQEDEIDIMELVRKLIKDWKLLLKWGIIAAVIGVIIAFGIPKEYTSSAVMAPEIASKSGSGNLSSLASLAGINLGSMSNTDAMYPELYPQIVSSRPFMIEMFNLPVSFTDKKNGTVETDLYDYMVNYTKSPWWSAILKAPMKALGWLMGLFSEKVEKVEGHDSVDPYHLTKEQSSVLKALNESISVSVDKKTYMISLGVVSQNPKVAADIASAIIERLQNYVVNYRTEKSRHDLEYYETLYADAQKDYYAAQQKYARYVDANQGVVRQSVLIEGERLQNEANLAYELYNQTAQQVQVAKAKVQQETPVVTVIQPPTIPLVKTKPSKAKMLVAFGFLGVCCAALWSLWGRDAIASLKSGEKKEEEE